MRAVSISRAPVVAVLGASGFIGCNLVFALAKRGYRVKAFDKYPSPIATVLSTLPLVEVQEGDFFNQGDLRATLEGVNVLFHLVSTTLPKISNDDPLFDADSNICGTLRLLDIAVEQKVDKIIFSSSGGTVYGVPQGVPISENHPTEPICSYGVSKLAIEKFLALYHRLHGIKTCSLRLANPYGPLQGTTAEQGVIAVFMGNVLNNKPIHVCGDGSIIRDFIYIDDIVKAFINVSESDFDCEIYNVGSGIGHTLNDIINMLNNVINCNISVRYGSSRIFDVPSSILDITKIRNTIGWSPEITLEKGLDETWNYISNGVFHGC
jgi:UDP-glucose 4-epimerase